MEKCRTRVCWPGWLVTSRCQCWLPVCFQSAPAALASDGSAGYVGGGLRTRRYGVAYKVRTDDWGCNTHQIRLTCKGKQNLHVAEDILLRHPRPSWLPQRLRTRTPPAMDNTSIHTACMASCLPLSTSPFRANQSYLPMLDFQGCRMQYVTGAIIEPVQPHARPCALAYFHFQHSSLSTNMQKRSW
jgi:hypothetical protein